MAVITVVPSATILTSPVVLSTVAVAGVPLVYVTKPSPTPVALFVNTGSPSFFVIAPTSSNTIVDGINLVSVTFII